MMGGKEAFKFWDEVGIWILGGYGRRELSKNDEPCLSRGEDLMLI